MAKVVEERIKTIYCQRVEKEVALIEERVYPIEMLPDLPFDVHRVRAQRCSCGVECNLKDYPCKWSGINPNYDPFAN